MSFRATTGRRFRGRHCGMAEATCVNVARQSQSEKSRRVRITGANAHALGY